MQHIREVLAGSQAGHECVPLCPRCSGLGYISSIRMIEEPVQGRRRLVPYSFAAPCECRQAPHDGRQAAAGRD